MISGRVEGEAMIEVTAQEAKIAILVLLITVLEREDFSSCDLDPNAERELRKAKNRQLEVLQSNLNYERKKANEATLHLRTTRSNP